MSQIPFYNKDPDAIEVMTLDWSFRLGGATISSSTWTGTGITIVTDAVDGRETSVKVSGGTLGETHRVTNRVVTSAGETLDQSIDVFITEK